MKQHTDKFLQFAASVTCREYTLPRDDKSSHPKFGFKGIPKFGPVLEVTTSYLQGRYGVEIRIESVNKDNSHSWVRISHRLICWSQIWSTKSVRRQRARDLKMIFGINLSTLNIGLMMYGRARWQEAEATRKLYWSVRTRKIYLRALQVHSGRNPIDPSLQDYVWIPKNFFEYIYHIGCAISSHSITNSGLTAGGQKSSRDRQTVFFTAVNPMHKDQRDPQELDLIEPRLASYKQKWKVPQDTVYWVDIQLAQRKGLNFYLTRSNAIILYDTLQAYFISKVFVMESGEIIYKKVYESPLPPPKIFFER